MVFCSVMCFDFVRFFIFSTFFRLTFAQEYHVLNFNASGNGVDNDTPAVRAALNAAAASNGGRVIFDEGYTFRTGCFNVTSNVILDIRGTLLVSNHSDDYVLVQPALWMGRWELWSAVIFSYYANNITITGGGLLDGQGQYWWNCFKNTTLPPCSSWGRPNFIQLTYSTNIEINNIRIKDSPSWNIHLANTTNVHITNINITTPTTMENGWYTSYNTDGVDIDCSVNVTVENSYISNGDDAISVKSGLKDYGRAYGRMSENILIRNLTVGTGGGLAIGSETAKGVRNVTFKDCTLKNTHSGILVKTEPSEGGLMQDITYSNISMQNVSIAIMLTMNYSYHWVNETFHPQMQNIILDEIFANGSEIGWIIEGLPTSNFENVYFSNINITNTNTITQKCMNIVGTCANSTVFPYCPPCIAQEACFDASSDCTNYQNFCSTPAYHATMCDLCRKSCNLCESC